MDGVVPWSRLLGLIAPHYPKIGPKGGRPPILLETMLRVYFLQNWYALSDLMAEETLYESKPMRRFAGIELGDDRILDETTILNFRHLLERYGLTEAIFAAVNAHFADKGITLCSGTLVDATIMYVPSSTKNKAGARDSEMSSTKKGNDWFFGMKVHIGVDAESGVTHSLDTSTVDCMTAGSGTHCCMATRSRCVPTKATSAPGLAASGVSWAKPRKAASCIRLRKEPTALSPRCGHGSSIPSGLSNASSAM
jgi:hypothetical protein